MAEKKAYVYKFNAFGAPLTSGAPAVRLDINDIFSDIARLDIKKSDSTGRILDLRSTTGGEPIFIHVLVNNKSRKIVHGILCSIKDRNHPDKFDWLTGDISPLSIREDLIEKSHFMIDASNGMMAFQRGRSSPHTGLLATYIMSKLTASVIAISIDVHIRKDITEKLKAGNKRGGIKLFEIKIKKTALPRVDLLGAEASNALKSLATIPDAESIGVVVSLEKYKRSGGFSVDSAVDNLKRFLGMQTSDSPSSDVETALIKIDDEVINLLTNKFSIEFEIPSSIMNSRSVDSAAVIDIMEKEYKKRKSDI